ncbi:hypothetical protein LC653_31825 [Nostoc sp. CHAB 5784]|uniref:hypothetical protein n=1 Tax=Nostoc mirabile TaxID=2907820 RepID=UPI001E4B4931|nr:hypothetical protein [Nostoc mirabile]MCC5668325.1 hypothetical protein [Nostoc mirabile CHAB5784]
MISTVGYSFSRTCLTEMYRSGMPLKAILEISGNRTLSAEQKYLEVLDEDLESAVYIGHFAVIHDLKLTYY